MSEFKGTPGPWEDEGPNVDGERCIFGSNDYGVCVTIPAGNPDMRPDVSVANARLLASSPVLLEALQAAIASFDEWAEYADPSSLADAKERLAWVDQARAAISLALGE